MTDQPTFGQRQENYQWIACYRHPREQAISQCKRCQNHTCLNCTVPTEVATLCATCATGTSAGENPSFRVVNGGGSKPSMLRKTASWKPTIGGVELSSTNFLILITVAVSVLGMLFPTINAYLAFNPIFGYFQPWRFLTVMLVHGGLMHLLLNMYSLYLVGNALERSIGFATTLQIYLASVLGGSFMSLLWVVFNASDANVWTVGASGGIFGLFAAIYVIQRAAGLDARAMGLLLVVNLGLGFVFPGISWQGHVGGLLVGATVTWALWKFARPKPGYTLQQLRNRRMVILGFSYLLLVAGIVACYLL